MIEIKDAELDNAQFKAAVRGSSGSGKTWWATAVAIGLHKYIGSTKPIAYWDTENGLSYVLPHFKHNGIGVKELKARAFALAGDFFSFAEANCDIAIIDSVTHLWEELIQSYLKRKHKDKLAVWDWGKLKPEYREGLLNRIVNTPLHLIICGRISDIFEYVQVDGEQVLTTTGSKMSAEKNTEYEPSLTVELERFTLNEEELRELAKASKGGVASVKRINKAMRFRMTVIKDRANVLGGIYEFQPHPGEFITADNDIWLAVKRFCDALSIGGKHTGIDLGTTSEGMFASPDTSWQERERQKTILLEEIEAEMKTHFGQSKEDKIEGVRVLKDIFGTASWTAIQSMELTQIKDCHFKLMDVFYPDRLAKLRAEQPAAEKPAEEAPRAQADDEFPEPAAKESSLEGEAPLGRAAIPPQNCVSPPPSSSKETKQKPPATVENPLAELLEIKRSAFAKMSIEKLTEHIEAIMENSHYSIKDDPLHVLALLQSGDKDKLIAKAVELVEWSIRETARVRDAHNAKRGGGRLAK